MIPLLKPVPALLALGMACVTASAFAQSLSPLVPTDGAVPSTWRFVGFPKSRADIPHTRFELADVQGERALKVSTRASYGTWVHDLPKVPAGRLQWRWRLDQPLTADKGGQGVADILSKAGDDAALKVCVMLNHPLDRVPFVESTVLRIARSVSGEDLPAATLCYVWDSTYPAGLQGANPYSQRVRFITLQGLGAPLGQWQTESRDVGADFARLFADESPAGTAIPTVRAVLIGADSDNTGTQSVGWVNALQWRP